jgi:hypothetical protein
MIGIAKVDRTNIQGSSAHLSSRERLVVMQHEIAVIKAQIGNAKARLLADGTYADPEWFAAANSALRFKQVEYQRLQLEISNENSSAKNGQPPPNSGDTLTFDVSMLLERERENGAAEPSLHDKAIAVLQDIASIKAQIERAKSRPRDGKGYSDSEWFQAANTALKYKQVEHQRLLQEIGKQQKIAKALRVAKEQQLQNTFERTFIRTARDLLDRDTYIRLLQETERRTTSKPAEGLATVVVHADASPAGQETSDWEEAEGEDVEHGPSPGG